MLKITNQCEIKFADTATISDIADHGCWKWPTKWNNQFSTITNIPVPHLIPKVPDSTVWITNKGKEA